jgi:hypothetical protein
MKSFAQIQRAAAVTVGVITFLVIQHAAVAQFGGPPPGPRGPARDIAPIDLTGQWVSVVTEDWRFRIATPPKNDYPGLPLNAAARAVADAWDPARDEADGSACKSYGAAAIMRVPTRLRVSWDNDSTLKIETDVGRQTRLFRFGDAPARGGDRTWQGESKAEWLMHSAGFGQPPVNGALKSVTTGMRAGYLRKNGVPYSENAVVTEYFDLLTQHDGTQWLVVLTIVDDSEYLTSPVITSSNFRRQPNRSGWDPTPCSAY